MSDISLLRRASQMTAENLRTVAQTLSLQELSKLSLPEVEKVVQLIAQIIPAGNVPGMILSGLARLPGRRIPAQKMVQDINALFSGVEQILDQAVYGAFFAGPAAVIWGYQNLLKLAGKDPKDAFPEGAWQFYVDYALREDTARHANETHGFDTLLNQNNIHLTAVDRVTAWVMASVMCLHQFNELLENEWYERVSISLLRDVKNSAKYAKLIHQWDLQKPYRREADAADMDYPKYRRSKFDQFLKKELRTLPADAYRKWADSLRMMSLQELPAYKKQMSILAYLKSGPYGETRVPFELTSAQIGIIHRNSYYLLPICEPGTDQPLNVLTARSQITSLMESPFPISTELASFARVKRTSQLELRKKLSPLLRVELDNLRFAPILISADTRPRSLPLSELRQAERGVGDHALTIFDTGETFVFDQSHIFFDGGWGAALAEIMSNEALSWARYLSMLAPATSADSRKYTSLTLAIQPPDANMIQQAPHVSTEASAETNKVNLKACLALRKMFKLRSDLIQLTINDLLVLYRAIHAAVYQPSPALTAQIDQLAQTRPDVADAIRAALTESHANPAILIPMDASLKSPRERLYPLNMEIPLGELNLLGIHSQTIQSLDIYDASAENRDSIYVKFDGLQRLYLATLAGFSAILAKAKQIAIQGESASVGTIKLLAHLPQPLQRLLDRIPDRFEVLNNLIKGREVFSNVGQVSPASTLTRFMTAKDDNNQKQLAWGILTDAQGVLRINLRDFRPHVSLLQSIGRKDLANMMVQDYIDSFAYGMNVYIRDLARITQASRETK